MSRQYISTFRRKLNLSQTEQQKPKLSKSTFYRPTTPVFLKKTRRNTVASLRGEKNEKHKEKKKIDRTKVSLEVEQNKIQVGILESALANLRLKERRALCELEKEMRKYRNTAERNFSRRRQAKYGYNRSWENFFPSIENEEEVTLKRPGRTKEKDDASIPLSLGRLRYNTIYLFYFFMFCI